MTKGSVFRYLVHTYSITQARNMQVNEKKANKVERVGRPGLTDKRIWIRNKHKDAVVSYQRILGVRAGRDFNWTEALEHLIETHPATKKLMPL